MSKFVFPAFALVVAIYFVWEQANGNYREAGRYYVYGLAFPVIIMAAIQLIKDVVQTARPLIDPGESEAEAVASPGAAVYLKVVIFIGLAIVALILLPVVGYPIAFGLFMITNFIMLGYRKPIGIAILTLGTLAVIQLIFVQALGTHLPKGIFAPWL